MLMEAKLYNTLDKNFDMVLDLVMGKPIIREEYVYKPDICPESWNISIWNSPIFEKLRLHMEENPGKRSKLVIIYFLRPYPKNIKE